MQLDIMGHRLRTARKLIGVSRKEIEKKYNISANSIKIWENGKCEIGITRLTNYLRVFKDYGIPLSLDSFLDYTTNRYLDKVSLPNESVPTYNFNVQDTFQSLKDKKDLQLVANTITNSVGVLLEKREHMLQALFDNMGKKIIFKDENNFIVRINHLAATVLGGRVDDFEEKSVYNLFPQMAKKYHEHDLNVLQTNKAISIVEEVIPINSDPITISFSLIPIISSNTGRMVLIIF